MPLFLCRLVLSSLCTISTPLVITSLWDLLPVRLWPTFLQMSVCVFLLSLWSSWDWTSDTHMTAAMSDPLFLPLPPLSCVIKRTRPAHQLIPQLSESRTHRCTHNKGSRPPFAQNPQWLAFPSHMVIKVSIHYLRRLAKADDARVCLF